MLESEIHIHFIYTILSILPTNPHFFIQYISIYDAQLHPTAAMCLCKYCILFYLKIVYNFTFAS